MWKRYCSVAWVFRMARQPPPAVLRATRNRDGVGLWSGTPTAAVAPVPSTGSKRRCWSTVAASAVFFSISHDSPPTDKPTRGKSISGCMFDGKSGIHYSLQKCNFLKFVVRKLTSPQIDWSHVCLSVNSPDTGFFSCAAFRLCCDTVTAKETSTMVSRVPRPIAIVDRPKPASTSTDCRIDGSSLLPRILNPSAEPRPESSVAVDARMQWTAGQNAIYTRHPIRRSVTVCDRITTDFK